MLARLQFELQERQRLEAARKELLAQKGKLTKDNADKKAALDLLDKQLEDFITVRAGLFSLETSRDYADHAFFCRALARFRRT